MFFAVGVALLATAFVPGGPLASTPFARAATVPVAMNDALEARYKAIAAAKPAQREAYAAWLASGAVDAAALEAEGAALGIAVDVAGGQIAYAPDFESKRLPLCFDFIYCRHGKTTGNTEPRVYQGYVDEPNNALNAIGLGQAEEAADKLDALNLSPDLIVFSPLSRAADTGGAFVKRHGIEMLSKVEKWEEAAEMRFGAWDNVMVKDLDDENICHLFYLDQNAIVKPAEPYVSPDGKKFEAENFVEVRATQHRQCTSRRTVPPSRAEAPRGATACAPTPLASPPQVLTRQQAVLAKLNARMAPLAKEGKRPLVVMYGHSMAGAALGVLTGNGKVVDGQSYLGFDGKYILPNATPVYLHPKP